VAIELIRTNGSKSLERAIYLNTNSPKAAQKIAEVAKNQLLSLERDPRTGLEKVKSLPVGYPHPFLDPEGQGILVKEFLFNGKKDDCAMVEFVDNSWVGGFTLSDERCTETQKDAEATWSGKLSPEEFAGKERDRIRKTALLSAKKRGIPEKAAKELVENGFKSEFGNDISMVGNAMRNLTQCNQYALGGVKRSPQKPNDTQPAQESSGAQ
jgi:hypothetical protein